MRSGASAIEYLKELSGRVEFYKDKKGKPAYYYVETKSDYLQVCIGSPFAMANVSGHHHVWFHNCADLYFFPSYIRTNSERMEKAATEFLDCWQENDNYSPKDRRKEILDYHKMLVEQKEVEMGSDRIKNAHNKNFVVI